MPVSDAEYKKLLARERNRYPNDRDRAVRSANIAAGYGSSTAERKGGGGGAKKAAPAAGKDTPKAKPSGGAKPKKASPFALPGSGKAPTPTPKPTQFPPDLAPSPNPMAANSPVGPGNAAAPFGNAIPPGVANFTPEMNPAMSQASILQTMPPELMAPMPILAPGRPPAPAGGFPAAPPPPGGGLTGSVMPAPQFGGTGRDGLAALAAQAGIGGMGRQFPPASPLLDPRLQGY